MTGSGSGSGPETGLKALSWCPRHRYAASEWLERVTGGTLLVVEGTLSPALHRLEGRGWIAAEWGTSENRRRANFYRLTDEGRCRLREQDEGRRRLREQDEGRRLREQEEAWSRYSEAVARALAAPSEP